MLYNSRTGSMNGNFKMKRFIIAMIALLLSGASLSAEQVPTAIYPELMRKSLQNEQPKAGQQVQPPIVTQPSAEKPAIPKEAAKITFVLNGVILTGNTVYSA